MLLFPEWKGNAFVTLRLLICFDSLLLGRVRVVCIDRGGSQKRYRRSIGEKRDSPHIVSERRLNPLAWHSKQLMSISVQ